MRGGDRGIPMVYVSRVMVHINMHVTNILQKRQLKWEGGGGGGGQTREHKRGEE